MPNTIVLIGDSYSDQNLYYKTHFLAGDPFVYFEHDGQGTLIVNSMEQGRAQKESSLSTVRSYDDFGYRDLIRESGQPSLASARMVRRVLAEHGVEKVTVEGRFPVDMADALRGDGVELEVTEDLYTKARRRKSAEEVEAIAEAQAGAQRATARAIEMIASSEPRGDDLYLDGSPLTSERIYEEIEILLLREGMELPQGAVIAAGPGAADPHFAGAGVIKVGQAVVLDIFPRGKRSRYWGDITRTVVKGEPGPVLRAMYDAVLAAQEAALAAIGPGVNGKDVHAAAQRKLQEAGFDRVDGGPRYIHTTGHGVGLDIHEAPNLGNQDVELVPGDVVTVEPGLYDPEIGGIRIEDTVVVTETGYRNLTDLPKQFIV